MLTARKNNPISLEAYHRMGEAGAFEGRRVELVDGAIVEMSPMGMPHRIAIVALGRHLEQVALQGLEAVQQIPLRVGAGGPELVPDIMVTPHLDPTSPSTVPLIVEISDSTLSYDLGKKAALYASGGAPEYWVVDLNSMDVIVHQSPTRGGYLSVRRGPWSEPIASPALRSPLVLSEVLRALWAPR